MYDTIKTYMYNIIKIHYNIYIYDKIQTYMRDTIKTHMYNIIRIHYNIYICTTQLRHIRTTQLRYTTIYIYVRHN